MALSLDLLTMLTVSGILAILAIYVIVVYKKGWLKRESKTDQAYYLCPSQKCRRVFKKPVWLTDLSKTPPESYQACPHCGMNVQTTSLSSPVTAQLETAPKSPLTKGDIRNPQDGLHFTRREAVTAEPEQSSELTELSSRSNGSRSPPRSEAEKADRPFFQLPHIRKEPQQKPSKPPKGSGEEGSLESQRKCSHFFGYVRTLPKNTPIPDECLWCPSIVDCLSHEKRVEAEA
jgi:hypothetical protein